MYFDIKKFYVLSALSLFSLLLTILVSIVSGYKKNINNIPQPTPVFVTNKIIKKVTKYITSAPQINDSLKNNQTNNNLQTNTVVTKVQTPTAGPAPLCTITIDNVKYNISSFRNIHSGGDIFKCSSDMSNDFWSKHGQKQLSVIQKYRL